MFSTSAWSTWYFQIRDAKVIKAIAFFDSRDFDEFLGPHVSEALKWVISDEIHPANATHTGRLLRAHRAWP